MSQGKLLTAEEMKGIRLQLRYAECIEPKEARKLFDHIAALEEQLKTAKEALESVEIGYKQYENRNFVSWTHALRLCKEALEALRKEAK